MVWEKRQYQSNSCNNPQLIFRPNLEYLYGYGFRGGFRCKHLMWIFCTSNYVMSVLVCRWMTPNKTSTRIYQCHLPLWICNVNTIWQTSMLFVKVRDQLRRRRVTICSSSCLPVGSTLSYWHTLCTKLPELPVVLDYVPWKGCTATYKKGCK